MTTDLIEVLKVVEGQGLTVETDGQNLLVSPRRQITPEVRDLLRQHKLDLVRWLAPVKQAPWGDSDPYADDDPDSPHLGGWDKHGRPIYFGTRREWRNRFHDGGGDCGQN